MSIGADLLSAWPGLLAIGGGVGLLALFGRDPKGADEHNVSDYHEPDEVVPHAERLTRSDLTHLAGVTGGLRNREVVAEVEDDDLPPAPSGMDAGSPLYAETLFESWRRETPAEAAARFLREVGESERAKAGIRPITSPATDRDYTGSFPVARAA